MELDGKTTSQLVLEMASSGDRKAPFQVIAKAAATGRYDIVEQLLTTYGMNGVCLTQRVWNIAKYHKQWAIVSLCEKLNPDIKDAICETWGDNDVYQITYQGADIFDPERWKRAGNFRPVRGGFR